MEIKTDIADELKFLSPLIAGIDKVNVFTVPQGYFDSISVTVLACLREEQHIFNLAGEEGSTPEGYFDQLAGSILDKIKAGETAADELRNLSPLLYDIQHKNVFAVPAGYFENLHIAVIDQLKTTGTKEELKEISPILDDLRSKHVFIAPDGYFESLPGIITAKVKTAGTKEELKEISPVLYGLQSKNLFEVPDNYFAHFPDNMLKNVTPQTAKVVNMRKRNVFFKYAVAAMMTGVTALGVYKYIDRSPATGTTIEQATVATLDASIEKGKNMNDVQFNEALQNLTGADIANYLENNGDVTDVAVLRNNLEDITLPSQDDYLLDETTLENYLKEIEKTTLNN